MTNTTGIGGQHRPRPCRLASPRLRRTRCCPRQQSELRICLVAERGDHAGALSRKKANAGKHPKKERRRREASRSCLRRPRVDVGAELPRSARPERKKGGKREERPAEPMDPPRRRGDKLLDAVSLSLSLRAPRRACAAVSGSRQTPNPAARRCRRRRRAWGAAAWPAGRPPPRRPPARAA